MDGVTFEGFLDSVTPRQREYIESVVVKLGHNDAKVKVEPVGKPGDNYGADVRRIIVESAKGNINMVAKIAPAYEQYRQAIDIGKIFLNESVMYTELFPKYTELEKEAGIPESERLLYAKCYGCLLEEPNEIILLEDLKVKGFTMLDKFKSLSDEAIKLILNSLAALHSLSYVLRDREPETYNTLTEKFKTIWETFEECESHYQQMEDGLLSVITNDYKKYLVGKITQTTKYFAQVMQENRNLKSSVIIQGDSWTNNFMFQYKGDKLASCCMIDYQLSCVNSPASDLGYMIFNCTDHEMRMKHFHEWLDYYHAKLDKYLTYHGLKVDQLFTKEDLKNAMKSSGNLSLAQGVMVSSIVLRENEDAEKTKAQMADNEGNVMDSMVKMFNVSALSEGTIKLFRSRLEGLVDSHLALGLIE
ncbi:uncharacterized protein LOC126371279 [Pectinophora gossypiella]|nr:uncharacterized protein LOC126371279 [Pectinophora gossypiella]